MKILLSLLKLFIKNKAMFKNLNLKKDWKTTFLGILTIVLMVLHSLGVISPEQSEGIESGMISVINALGGDVFGTITVAVVGLGAILQLFAKDPKKTDTE